MAELLIYQDIGSMYDGITAKDVADKLSALAQSPGTELNVRVNSLGGYVSDGLAIRNQIRKFGNTQKAMNKDFKVNAIVDGYAYSAGSVICTGCDQIIMNQGSMMMVHRAWTIGMGNAQEMRKVAETLDQLDGNLAQIYASWTGKSEKDIMALLTAETFFTAEEAVKAGFATRVDEGAIANLATFGDIKLEGAAAYIKFMRDRAENKAKDHNCNLEEWAAIAHMEAEQEILALL